jgi:hypothetical protein
VAGVISALGTGAMMTLVFTAVGDLFPPAQRAKWIGLLNIPTGIFSLIDPGQPPGFRLLSGSTLAGLAARDKFFAPVTVPKARSTALIEDYWESLAA